MHNKIKLTDSYEKFAISNMRDYILNEELHVFRNCVDAIEEISSEIFDAADLNHTIVHYILYSRLWEFDDRKHQREYEDKINKFVKKLKQDISNIGVSI